MWYKVDKKLFRARKTLFQILRGKMKLQWSILHPHSYLHLLQRSKIAIIIIQARLIMDKPPLFTVTSTEPAKVMAAVTYASEKILMIDSFWLSTGTNAEVMCMVVECYTSVNVMSDLRQS